MSASHQDATPQTHQHPVIIVSDVADNNNNKNARRDEDDSDNRLWLTPHTAGGEESPLLTETRQQQQPSQSSNSLVEEDRHSDSSSSSSGDYHSSVEDEHSYHRKHSWRETRAPADQIDHPLSRISTFEQQKAQGGGVLLFHQHPEQAPTSHRSSPSILSNPSIDGSGSTNTTSRSSRRRRRTTTTATLSSTNSSTGLGSTNNRIQQQQPRGGLRASLDAGMAAVRRWIRSKDSIATSDTSRRTNNNSTTTSLGEEDLYGQDPRMFQYPILEEEDDVRQRSLSEPDALSIRGFLVQRSVRRRRSRAESSEEISHRMLSSSAAAVLNTNTARNVMSSTASSSNNTPAAAASSSSFRERSTTTTTDGMDTNTTTTTNAAAAAAAAAENTSSNHMTILPGDTSRMNNNTTASPQASASASDADNNNNGNIDPERQARIRWIRINRRFQLVITIVALLFSLLLFSILICWVVLTSAYVVSFDKSCDVPLKPYFWLVTLQLVLDVFRSDIMRFVFHWDANANQRIPCRVITYNLAYLLYALLVLRLGVRSVFVEDDVTCHNTAPELFDTSVAFVSLSIAAWTTIVCGYLLPFCIVAALLTYNGYNPSSSTQQAETGATQPVFPAAYATTGAPPGCVDLLRVVPMDEFPADYPRECCICMEEFDADDFVVETACKHVFHKQCCREWLRQSRTCPVCRTDIPSTLEEIPESGEGSGGGGRQASPRIPLGPTGRPVVGLIRILQSRSESIVSAGPSNEEIPASRQASPTMVEMSPPDLEEGRVNQSFDR